MPIEEKGALRDFLMRLHETEALLKEEQRSREGSHERMRARAMTEQEEEETRRKAERRKNKRYER